MKILQVGTCWIPLFGNQDKLHKLDFIIEWDAEESNLSSLEKDNKLLGELCQIAANSHKTASEIEVRNEELLQMRDGTGRKSVIKALVEAEIKRRGTK